MSWSKFRAALVNNKKNQRQKKQIDGIETKQTKKSGPIVSLSGLVPDSNPQVKKTKPIYLIIHYTLRLLVLVGCFIGCFAQIGTIMNIFFSYPAIVFVDLHRMEKLLLPAITICNDNRVMRSKLSAYNEEFAYKWNYLVNRSHEHPNAALKLYQQRLIDNLIRTMLTNLTVSDFITYGNTADDFLDINFFRCASDKSHPNNKCLLLSNLLTTAQENGNCFTLFHKSDNNKLNEIAINSGLSESAVVRGSVNESVNIEMSLKSFAPNEIMRMRVNFQIDEYTTLNEPVSGRFIIHDNNHVAVIREKSYRVEPGKYYIFYISKQTDELLQAPYVTDCRNYEKVQQEEKESEQNETANILLSEPSSKDNCIVGCVARKTILTCNCWPPELPFLYTGNQNSSENFLKWCDWRERPPIDNWKDKPNHLTWFQYCFNVHETICNSQCKSDCRIDRYTILKEQIEWPSKERIEHVEEKNELRNLRDCCAVISIRYWSTEQTINRYKPRFETAEFTSYVGGLLSMWLGFSLFGFYGLSEKMIIQFVNFLLRRHKNSKKQSIQEEKHLKKSKDEEGQTQPKVLVHQNSRTALLSSLSKVGTISSEEDQFSPVPAVSVRQPLYERKYQRANSYQQKLINTISAAAAATAANFDISGDLEDNNQNDLQTVSNPSSAQMAARKRHSHYQ